MSPRSWTAYAIAGQSNARGNNAGNLTGTRIGVVHVVDREAGAYAAGTDRSPTWWNSSPSTSAPRVGPAAGMAVQFASRGYTGRGLRLCKYAVGGTTIAQWISTYAAAHIATMSATGWTFSGLVWAQGETDATNAGTTAASYAADLSTLVGLYRATFPDLPVCVVQLASGFTSLGPNPVVTAAEVRQGQADYVASDALATMIDMESWVGTQHDGIHWTADAQLDCGARALAALEAL